MNVLLPGLSGAVLALGLWPAPLPSPDEKVKICQLEEISVFELADTLHQLGGARADCEELIDEEVKAYPEMSSERPLYGSVTFGHVYGQPDSGSTHYFALDESQGTDKGYDKLYLDLNEDLDLTNDKPLLKQENPPEGARYSWGDVQQACFDYIQVPCDYGGEQKQPVEVMPRLVIHEFGDERYIDMTFVGTKARRGKLTLGSKELVVILMHEGYAAQRYDDPWTGLLLLPEGAEDASPIYWWGGDNLGAVHEIDGQYYSFNASANGHVFMAKFYNGKFGQLRMGAGERQLDRMTVYGSLSSETSAVAVGQVKDGWPKPTPRHRLPVGKYRPNYLTVQYGRLQLSLSNNYWPEAGESDDKEPVYGIDINTSEPFVLDFRAEPKILFAKPAKEERVAVGERLRVEAVLVDPTLDMMFRGLDDTGTKEEQQIEQGDGTFYSYTRDRSLDPKITVTRRNGEQVAHGTMPFG